MYIAVGLGNPGGEYENTRHNAGRLALAYVGSHLSQVLEKKLKILEPDTYMNHSGKFVLKRVKSKKAAQKLIVVYDDLDLPLGAMKISYNRGSGGHKGLDSIIRALKTREFTRIRIGISPSTPKGKVKKPKTEQAVDKFILGEFKKSEIEVLKKVFKRVTESLEVIISDGPHRAMNEFN